MLDLGWEGSWDVITALIWVDAYQLASAPKSSTTDTYREKPGGGGIFSWICFS